MAVVGWDIGGVNTKVACVDKGAVLSACTHPFELQRNPDGLVRLLRDVNGHIGASADALHALTMTAELSQMFRTKREGVRFIVNAFESAFPARAIHVYTVSGRFLPAFQAIEQPLSVAAANWSAAARMVARTCPDAVLIDVGTTTTDVIPIVDGEVAAVGRTDPERLVTAELVYTGALRTPAEAMANYVPLGNALAGVSAEGFALAGDVHVWRGDLDPSDYTCPTPDGRPPTREFARERLARVVCADREMLDEAAITRIAEALARAQTRSIHGAIQRVLEGHASIRVAVVTGLGAFLAEAALASLDLEVVRLSTDLGAAGARSAPAVAVALLLEEQQRL